jgi:hypothetical protein
MHRADVVATELSLRQCGVFAGWQLDLAGIPKSVRQRRVQSGAWLRPHKSVYALPSVVATYEQQLWVACLAVSPDAVVSHESAAEIHGVPNVVRGRLILTVAHSSWHRKPGVFVHQLSDVLPEQRTEIRGLPVTTIPRTIVDLAAVVHPARLRHVVEDTKHARLTTYEAIGTCLASVARRGKPGVRSLTLALDTLAGGQAVSTSTLERRTIELISRYALPMPVDQYPFPGRQFVEGCVDFAYPEAKLILETDGRRWHSRIREITRDRERDLEAARHGWQTLRFLYEHVVDDPANTAETIRTVFNHRLALLAS